MKKLWQSMKKSILFQLLFIVVIWYGCVFLMNAVGWGQLGGVVGLVVLWMLLIHDWVRLDSVQAGAGFLMRHMLLFFIPAVLVILDHKELLGWIGVKLFFIILVGTVVVMLSTALTVEWLLRLHRYRQAIERLHHQQKSHQNALSEATRDRNAGGSDES